MAAVTPSELTSSAPASLDVVTRDRIDDLGHQVVRLASLATAAIAAASEALADGDLDQADGVIADDDAVDAQRHEVEDECMRLLVRPGMTVEELRFVACTLRVAHELERTADLMVNVARSAWRLFPTALDASTRALIRRLGRQAALQVRIAVNAFVDRDLVAAAALVDMDDAIDDLHDLLVRHALERPSNLVDEATLQRAVQLTLVARHFERAGDHAVTIAAFTRFVVTGTHARGPAR